MYRQYQDLTIECWQHAGPRLGIADRALCLRADADAIRGLITIMGEIAGLPVPARRSLTLRPTRRPTGCSTIRIVLLPQSDDLHEMSATRLEEVATVELTPAGLEKSRFALDRWRDGGEDFSIHPRAARNSLKNLPSKDRETAEIWFWRGMEP